MKKIFLITLCIFATITIANAITRTSIVTSGNWNDILTWDCNCIPSATDSVVIDNGHNISVNVDSTCAHVSLTTPTSFSVTVLNVLTGVTFSVNGNIDINGDGTFVTTFLAIAGNGIINVTGNINLNSSNPARAEINMAGGASTLNIGGDIILNSGGTLSASSTSTINLNGSSAQTLTMGSSLVYNHITLNNSGPGVTLGGAITATNVTGNITVQSGIFDNGGFAIDGASADTFKVDNGTTFLLTGTSTYPTGFTDSLETASTVEYSGTTQTVSMPGSPYSNLTISGTGTKTLGAAIDVNGVLTINSGTTLDASVSNFNINLAGNWSNSGGFNAQSNTATFDGATTISGSSTNTFNNVTISGTLTAPSGNFNVAGNWSNTGTFTPGTGTVTLNGSTAQTITNVLGETFNNLTISNSAGISLSGDATVSNTLTMTSGNVNAGTDTLILGTSTSNEGTLSHASGNIIGKFKRWINTQFSIFLFPTGISTSYRPALAAFNNLTGGSLTAEFIASTPGNNGLPLGDGPGDTVYNAFTEGYWILAAANSLASTDYDIHLQR